MQIKPPKPTLIAVASGKGGVGKTWFAITLAQALSRGGRRVLLFDGDLGLANVDVQLGVTPAHDLGDVVSGRVTLPASVVRYEAGGFDILAGQSGSGALSALDRAHLDRALTALRRDTVGYDVVLLDLGAGVERPVRRMAAVADFVLVLATEEPTSLTDAYAVLKLHAADGALGQSLIVVNQASGVPAGERTASTLQRACATFLGRTPVLAGIVRRDDKVRESIRRQTPLLVRHPNSAAADDVTAIAARLDELMAVPSTRAAPASVS